MKRNGWNRSWLAAAAWPRRLALALALAVLAAIPARAQEERLPSVSDYRLPAPSASPTRGPSGRSQGPVDSDNPVVLRPSREPETAAPSAATEAPAPAPSARAPAASPAAAPAGRPAGTASPNPAPRPAAAPAAPGGAALRQPAPVSTASAPPPVATGEAGQPAASPAAAVPPITWNVHSARQESGPAIWPWLAGIAALLATNGLLLFLLLRRRQARAAANAATEYEAAQAAQTVSPAAPIAAETRIEPAKPAPAASAEGKTEAELDLIDLLAQHEPAPPVGAMAASPEPARPALDVFVNPLEVTLAARRLSATLMNTVLNYELVVANNSDAPIGPVTVAGDMIGAHASLSTRAQLELGGTDIAPQHRIEQLGPGASITVSGEFRLPLAAITPIRSGNAALFVPLARFRVEALRDGAPPLAVNRAFVIGESQDRPGAALKPFRLDLGPRLYSHIGQREVAATA